MLLLSIYYISMIGRFMFYDTNASGAFVQASFSPEGDRPVKALNVAALALMVVGALNWGLWGFFQFDLVAALFGGNSSILSRIIYSLVGLAGVYGMTLFGPLLSLPQERVAA